MKKRKLIGDILDNQMVDREKRNIGKVDGIVVGLRKDAPPRVLYLEIGAAVLARRLGRRWERVALWLNRKLRVREEAIYRIPWTKVKSVDMDIHVDIDGRKTPIWAWERWLDKHVIEKIPLSK